MAVLVDLQPLMIVSYVTIPDDQKTIKRFKNAFFDRLFEYVMPFTKHYGSILLVAEGGRSWRKDVYPFYKANRIRDIEKSPKKKADHAKMIEWFKFLCEDIDKYKILRILKTEGAEADDIIGLLASVADNPTVIISADKDFQQLQTNPNIKQYSLTQRKWITCEDPKSFLIEHIVRGDGVDNIPSIRRPLYNEEDLNRYADKKKKTPPVTKRFLQDFMNGIDYELYEKRYKENSQLIDLSKIPAHIKESIIETIGQPWKGDTTAAVNYFKDNDMGRFAIEFIQYKGGC